MLACLKKLKNSLQTWMMTCHNSHKMNSQARLVSKLLYKVRDLMWPSLKLRPRVECCLRSCLSFVGRYMFTKIDTDEFKHRKLFYKCPYWLHHDIHLSLKALFSFLRFILSLCFPSPQFPFVQTDRAHSQYLLVLCIYEWAQLGRINQNKNSVSEQSIQLEEAVRVYSPSSWFVGSFLLSKATRCDVPLLESSCLIFNPFF